MKGQAWGRAAGTPGAGLAGPAIADALLAPLATFQVNMLATTAFCAIGSDNYVTRGALLLAECIRSELAQCVPVWLETQSLLANLYSRVPQCKIRKNRC